MKTTWIASKKRSLFPVIMAAVFGLASHSCSEDPISHHQNKDTGNDLVAMKSEQFWVDLEGISVNAFEGQVSFEFPEEAVSEPTLFTVTLSQLSRIVEEETNMMNCGVTLSSSNRGQDFFNELVQLKLHYCLSDFNVPAMVDEEDITIYRVDIDGYAYSIGDCTVDSKCKMVNGNIDECGTYVVGEY
jgi:hypothetical protein